ncbi:MAG: hypothetical protein WC028_23255 [Candidatus Obscuribacterales bacterium]
MTKAQHCVDLKNSAALILLLMLSSTFACAFTSVLATPAIAKSEWVIETLHNGSGSYRYYVTDDGIKLENTGNGGIAVCTAPTWKISCFRPSDKLEFITDLKNFDKSLILAILSKQTSFAVTKSKWLQAESLKGLSCDKILLPDGATYWTPREMKTSPQVSEVVARYFNSANILAIPVRILRAEVILTPAQQKKDAERRKKSAVPWLNFKTMDRNNSERLTVELKGWKKVPYKASDFEYPKGYKRTNDLKDVIVSAAYRNDLIDIAKDFTDAEAEKSKNKKSSDK